MITSMIQLIYVEHRFVVFLNLIYANHEYHHLLATNLAQLFLDKYQLQVVVLLHFVDI